MTRYTGKDVRASFLRVTKAAAEAGVSTEGWTLHPGSPANGISYGLTSAGAPVPYLRSFGSFGIVGNTAREAVMVLDAMAATFELVARKGSDR